MKQGSGSNKNILNIYSNQDATAHVYVFSDYLCNLISLRNLVFPRLQTELYKTNQHVLAMLAILNSILLLTVTSD